MVSWRDSDELKIRKFISRHRTLSLATVDSDGLWCANVLYVVQGDELIFHSAENTRHGKAMVQNPHVAATITCAGYRIARLHGVQLAGIVTRTEDRQARRRYVKRFPIATFMELTLWRLTIEQAKLTAGVTPLY